MPTCMRFALCKRGYEKEIEDPSSAFEGTAFPKNRKWGRTAAEAYVKVEKENYC